jgi:hypothetical protein
MPKLFDRLAKSLFTAVNRMFSVDAQWISSGEFRFSGLVLFNDPTSRMLADDQTYESLDPWCEFLKPAFDGLIDLVNDREVSEILIIEGREYYVTLIEQLHDGNTVKAFLKLKAA